MYKHWKHMLEPKRDTGAMVGAGLLGALAGAALAYWLYATDAGARKRSRLARVGKTLKRHAGEIKDDIKETLEEGEDEDDEEKDEDDE